jgi:pseudouridine kinase
MEDSNPGRVEYCPGGVGRNIAENLHRLGVDVRFISVIGDDPGGQLIKASSAAIGLDIGHSLFLNSGQVTSVYIAMMDCGGELKLGLADMEILEQMKPEHLESKADIIMKSDIVVLDTNLPEHIIDFIVERFGKNGNGLTSPAGASPLFFLDAVSARKSVKGASRIGSFDTLKLGRDEAAAISGLAIPGVQPEKLKETADWFIDKGVRRVFITLGKEGVYTACGDMSFFTPVKYVPPVNTSGGGDAFMAGIVYGSLHGWDNKTIVSFSSAMAAITIQNKSTVSPEMSVELVQRAME